MPFLSAVNFVEFLGDFPLQFHGFVMDRAIFVIIISIMMLLALTRGIRLNRARSRLVSRTALSSGPRETKLLQTEAVPAGEDRAGNGDCLVSGLNSAQDIMVRAVSCRETVQESILRNDLSQNAGQKLAEVMASSLLMGAGLKANETLQVNMVGGDPNRIRNVMVLICDKPHSI